MPRKAWGSPGQLRAFRKMRAARKAKLAAKRGGKRRRRVLHGRKATGTVRIKFRRRARRNPTALIANPSFGYSRAYSRGFAAAFGKKRSKKRRRTGKRRYHTMAKRKRRRKSHARRPIRRRRRAIHRIRPSRRTRTIFVNPRHRRRRRRRRVHHRRHRRNPGFGRGGLLMRAFTPFAVGFVASMGAAVLDSALSGYPKVRQLVKVGGAVAIAFVGRKYPVASTAAIAALAASSGYPLGTRLAGGMVAHNPTEAVKGLGGMAGVYPEIGALLNGGVGALLSGVPDEGTAVMNYQTALGAADDDE